MIKDSGERREFESGAVRDVQEGKGRCDLMPLDIIISIYGGDKVLTDICNFLITPGENSVGFLCHALRAFINNTYDNIETAFLELSVHFEEGAKKYGEHNWEKGIPCHCYVDSAIRHYLKYLRKDSDERHDRAFMWNIVCLLWTLKHKPELDDIVR